MIKETKKLIIDCPDCKIEGQITKTRAIGSSSFVKSVSGYCFKHYMIRYNDNTGLQKRPVFCN